MYPKKIESRTLKKHLHTVFMATLLIVAKKWKQIRCSSIDKWIKKMWCIHTTDYYAALKKKEILSHATTCMHLDDIMWSEIASHKRTNSVWFHIYEVSKVVIFINIESRMVAIRGREEGVKGNCCLMSTKFQFLQDEKVLEIRFKIM